MSVRCEDLGHNLYVIDGYDLGLPNRTGVYIFNEERITILETGPSMSLPYIKQGMKELGRTLDEVDYIIVTHVHLDHAGGAGLLLTECPNAKVIIHPRGARHLIDPSRLIKGAKAVYKEKFEELFEPVIPIPEDRVVVLEDNSTLTISSERTLTFLDTPGHAAHHYSIYDPESEGVFTGDTIGIQYPDAKKVNKDIYIPSTSPNQFDPDAMLSSLERIMALEPKRIYFGHYGMCKDPKEVDKQIKMWLPRFLSIGKDSFEQHHTEEKLSETLFTEMSEHYQLDHSEDLSNLTAFLKMDASVSAMGIIHYFAQQEKAKNSAAKK
uniref:MBL fold metallo-hydrolase n=1 Tax=Bacillus sp. FJAT-44742 TaxID=2014005 RepID=UPI000C23B9BA|nr:MBL fold metallo-hydrolase [Bacillus sp. FJAT-44742]